MTTGRTSEQIIAEALEILESKVKTAEDIRHLVRLGQELEERLNEGDTWDAYETDPDWWLLRLWTRRN